jgi:pimeloyl-ACP methyl ester carboxylesterase
MQFTDFGGRGADVHFAHANAYPPGSYRRMIGRVTDRYSVKAIHWLPLVQPWRHRNFRDWHELVPDLIEFIETRMEKPVLAAGHSMGATVTMLAATRRPDLFRAIALIDPVFLSLKYALSLRLTPRRWRTRIPIVRKALGRPTDWATPEEAYQFHRRARVFRRVSDEVLTDYIDDGVVETDGGRYTLAFAREWEAKIYSTCPYVWPELRRCHVPMLAIRGAHSDVMADDNWARWKQVRPDAQFVEFSDAGHLVPLERPSEVGGALTEFFDTHRATRPWEPERKQDLSKTPPRPDR